MRDGTDWWSVKQLSPMVVRGWRVFREKFTNGGERLARGIATVPATAIRSPEKWGRVLDAMVLSCMHDLARRFFLDIICSLVARAGRIDHGSLSGV